MRGCILSTEILQDKRTVDEERTQNNKLLYRQYYEEIAKRQLSNNEAFDKAVLSLSSAGLGLSLTFFKFVVPLEAAVDIYLLKSGWFLFLASIICTMLSYFTSQVALKIELNNAEKYYLDDLDEYGKKTNSVSILNELLNAASGILFVCALIAIVLFVTNNI